MTSVTPGLLFEVSDLEKEIQSFPRIAAKYLAPGTEGVIQQMGNDLTNAMKYSRPGVAWKVANTNPIRTRASVREYMPDSHGELTIFAEITFIWVIDPDRSKGNSRAAARFRLTGNASTVIRIMLGEPHDASNAVEIAMWRMEIGDAAAPGTHFHVQVLGHDADPPFPKSLDIPRLPGLIVSPLACVEFAISELFQDSWKKDSVKATSDMNRWRGVQTKRTLRQLDWHKEQVASASGSPWTAIKMAKPHEDLFI